MVKTWVIRCFFMLMAATVVATARAEPIKFEAIITPKDDTTLSFVDGSHRAVRLVQREGKVTGDAPFAGATMLEWGLHDVTTSGGTGVGYLVFTHADNSVVYLKFQWDAIKILENNNQPRFLLSGVWEVVGSNGSLGRLTGLGTLQINLLSDIERQWIFEGNISTA